MWMFGPAFFVSAPPNPSSFFVIELLCLVQRQRAREYVYPSRFEVFHALRPTDDVQLDQSSNYI